MAQITYADKSTGDSFSASEANEIKSVVNENIQASSNTGDVVSFDTPKHFGDPTTPITGDVTFDFTNAVIGQVAAMIHNDSTEPTLPSEAKVASGSYVVDSDNLITFLYYSSGVVYVTYSQPA